jgi:hypothetical protein
MPRMIVRTLMAQPIPTPAAIMSTQPRGSSSGVSFDGILYGRAIQDSSSSNGEKRETFGTGTFTEVDPKTRV